MGWDLIRQTRGRRRFARDERGVVMLIFAIMLPVVVGGAAFGVETTYWYYKRLALQAAADASAYSAAIERRAGRSEDDVEAAAELAAVDNGFDSGAGTIEVTPQNLSGGGAVEVVLHEQAKRFFTAYFVQGNLNLTARAVATYNSAASACILALHPSASKAANFSGSSNLALVGCSVMANSLASDALNVQGSAHLSTECAISAGGVSATSGLTLTKCSSPITQAPPVGDPYASLPVPTPSGGCLNSPNSNGTINPGRYCNGLTLKDNITLNPGVYYLEGDFKANAGANVTGDGVTIYLAKKGSNPSLVSMNGNATVNLKAPTTGTYAGVLFFGDRSVTCQGNCNSFNGTAGSKMTGAIYFASQAIQYNGNFSGLNGCTQVVGSTVEWTGNTSVAADCTAYGMKPLPVLNIVRLTE